MATLILKKNLNVYFRGERTYIYGPDLFNNTISLINDSFNISKLENIDFSSHKMTDCGLDFLLFDQANDKIEDVQSKISFTSNSKKYYGYLIENKSIVSKRLPYPEEEIIKVCKLDSNNKSISLSLNTNFKLTDNYTALTKYLHKNIHPDIEGKWIFVRIQYYNYNLNESFNEIKVIQTKNLSNKYTLNSLYIDGEEIGCLYFSLI